MHRLQTQRLRLRWLTIEDAGLLLAAWTDPAFIKYVGDRGVRTVEAAEAEFVKGPRKLYDEFGYGPFRVSLADADQPIGLCGVFRREGLDDPDIGFVFLPEFRGHGYAGEAAQEVLRHAREDLGLKRLTAIVSSENAASIGLIKKLGLSFERMVRLPGADKDIQLYGVDW